MLGDLFVGVLQADERAYSVVAPLGVSYCFLVEAAMQTVQIELPRSVLVATGQDQEAFVLEAKLILATRLFETGQLSSGQAAELCELTRGQFLLEASRRGAPVVDLDREEMLREFADD